MSRHYAQVTRTSDTDAAAYLLASGLALLRVDAADGPRAMYVFADPQAQGREGVGTRCGTHRACWMSVSGCRQTVIARASEPF